jgi:hypothetical protein
MCVYTCSSRFDVADGFSGGSAAVPAWGLLSFEFFDSQCSVLLNQRQTVTTTTRTSFSGKGRPHVKNEDRQVRVRRPLNGGRQGHGGADRDSLEGLRF